VVCRLPNSNARTLVCKLPSNASSSVSTAGISYLSNMSARSRTLAYADLADVMEESSICSGVALIAISSPNLDRQVKALLKAESSSLAADQSFVLALYV